MESLFMRTRDDPHTSAHPRSRSSVANRSLGPPAEAQNFPPEGGGADGGSGKLGQLQALCSVLPPSSQSGNFQDNCLSPDRKMTRFAEQQQKEGLPDSTRSRPELGAAGARFVPAVAGWEPGGAAEASRRLLPLPRRHRSAAVADPGPASR
jgi:hypothetical protein